MDIRLVIYYLCIGLGAGISAVTGYTGAKRLGYAKKTIAVYITYGIFTGLLSALFMGQLQNFVMSLTPFEYNPSRLRIFGALLFLPVWLYFLAKYREDDYGELLDVFSAGTYGMLGISKIGCAVYGCCYGIEFVHGVSTPFETHSVFPVQLLECVLSLIIAVVIYIVANNKKHRKGTVYPISLILYGVMRFFVEYLRYYPEAERTYFFGVNLWQFISMVTVMVGFLWLSAYIHRGNNRDSQTEVLQCEE